MQLRYQKLVQRDVSEALKYYESIYPHLADSFWDELMAAIDTIRANPSRYHFDHNHFRRCNMNVFPYHILYRVKLQTIRIIAVRHNQRNPSFGIHRKF